MEEPMSEDDLNGLSERIIGCAFKVSYTLGCGFFAKPKVEIKQLRGKL
jgi:hypothetical protein